MAIAVNKGNPIITPAATIINLGKHLLGGMG
jgi:hypothetical protein